MDFDFRLHAHIIYLSLEHEIPLLSGSGSSLECYDERLQVIEKAMGRPSTGPMIKPTTDKLSHRATFLYGNHIGSCPRQPHKFPIQLSPQDDNSTSIPDSPAEKRALLDELSRVTEKTQILRYELPDDMPIFVTWKYLDKWKWALPQSSFDDCDEDDWAQASVSSMPEDADWDGDTVRE